MTDTILAWWCPIAEPYRFFIQLRSISTVLCFLHACPLIILAEVAGVFTNLFGGVAGSKFGLFYTLISSLFLQILCVGALMLIPALFGDLNRVGITQQKRIQATVWITAFQTFSGVAKDLMKLTGMNVIYCSTFVHDICLVCEQA